MHLSETIELLLGRSSINEFMSARKLIANSTSEATQYDPKLVSVTGTVGSVMELAQTHCELS